MIDKMVWRHADLFYRERREEDNSIRKVVAGIVMMVIAMIVFSIPGIFSSVSTEMLDTVELVIFLMIYLMTAHDTAINSITELFNGKIEIERLTVTIASLGTFFVGAYWEACAVMFVFMICENIKNTTTPVKDSVADMKGINIINVFTMIAICFAIVIIFVPPIVDAAAYGSNIKDFSNVWREWVYRGLICLAAACPCTMHIAENIGIKAKQNLITALVIKCIVLVITATGFMTMWGVVLAELLISCIVIINIKTNKF